MRKGMGDFVFLYIGIFVVWLLRGCKYSLGEEMRKVGRQDFSRRPEGVIGLVLFLLFVGFIVFYFCGAFEHEADSDDQ
jgi:hypothetical protein